MNLEVEKVELKKFLHYLVQVPSFLCADVRATFKPCGFVWSDVLLETSIVSIFSNKVGASFHFSRAV